MWMQPCLVRVHHWFCNLHLIGAGCVVLDASDRLSDLAGFNQQVFSYLQASNGTLAGASYVNYLDPDLGCGPCGDFRYLAWYYGGNADRLVAVKASVDPTNVFHRPQSIPVTLP